MISIRFRIFVIINLEKRVISEANAVGGFFYTGSGRFAYWIFRLPFDFFDCFFLFRLLEFLGL